MRMLARFHHCSGRGGTGSGRLGRPVTSNVLPHALLHRPGQVRATSGVTLLTLSSTGACRATRLQSGSEKLRKRHPGLLLDFLIAKHAHISVVGEAVGVISTSYYFSGNYTRKD